MKERNLKEWEKKIQVLFEKSPYLKKLIKSPIYYSNSPWAGEVNNYFLKKNSGSVSKDFYRVVFKKGSPKSLMTIGSGELSGLQTTSVVEKGRIAAVAGLEPVDTSTESSLLPMLLMMGIFGAIQNHLGYISNVCIDIRNRQIFGDHAKLERISEVILDCFESIPEMDQDMMRLNLARIVGNTDECLELLIVMREELARESHAQGLPNCTFNTKMEKVPSQNDQHPLYYPIQFIHQMMNHNVFAAYERFVAGKICQIVLSGNYSPSNIERSKQSVIRIKDTIRKVFEERIEAHKRGAIYYKNLILRRRNGEYLNNWTNDNLEHALSQQTRSISDIEKKLDELLDAKLESFDFLSRLANTDEIDVYLINGAIIINENEINALPNQQG
ncbi:hypothetical protein RC77_05335 [Pectobacterium brasiliense]|uniref:hypothetical protein n=1 Tax=Pectobacterium brasiliense TaxID=180957 RepID=UPI00057EBDF6|nr:hypothetical protein [Pectobacterium brasiliense]KHS70937.1 hypothetical protein RC77_05335 [Pectobacterium brasiliense]